MTVSTRSRIRLVQLFLLTLVKRGEKSNAYSMGASAEDAFDRYVERMKNRHESAADIAFLEGELADPGTHLKR